MTGDSGSNLPCAVTAWRIGFYLVTGSLCLVLAGSALLLHLASDAAHRLDATLFIAYLAQNSLLLAPTVILVLLWLSMTTVFGCTTVSRRPKYRTLVLVELAVGILLGVLWAASLWLQQATDQGYAYLSGQSESILFLQFSDLPLYRTMSVYIAFSVGVNLTSFVVWYDWLRLARTGRLRKGWNKESASVSVASRA